MDTPRDNYTVLSPKSLADSMWLWSYAAVSLVDIRHHLISPEESVRGYHLPASAFIYIHGSRADVFLDDTIYHTERFGLFHSGKGSELSICPTDDWLEYYMVLYKAGEPPFHKRIFQSLLEHTNPFRQQYGFAPQNPIYFAEQLRRMYEMWKQPTPLELFYEKSAFYQLVYEIYRELDGGAIKVLMPDAVAMARQYIDEHFHEMISIQWIASLLGISDSHLRREFNKRYGKSPQDYLIHRRLTAVRQQLATTNYTIKEIAFACGFTDELVLMRMFKSNFHMTASEYRAISTVRMHDYTIENLGSFPYNEKSRVSPDELDKEGAIYMLKQMRGKTIAAAALSLMLLMTACGTAPADFSGPGTTPTSAVTTQVEEGTRTIQTEFGEVEVPMNPKRIYATYNVSVGDLVLFGAPLIAHGAYYYDYVASVENPATGLPYQNKIDNIDYLHARDYEGIMSYQPDLIITHDPDGYDKMSAIAPTVYIPWDMELSSRITLIGEVLNRQQDAENLLKQFNQKLEDAKEKLEQAGVTDQTITILEGNGSYLCVYADNYGRGGELLYQYWGMKAPEIIQNEMIGKEEDAQWREPSFEVLPQYCGDYILFIGDIDSMTGNPIWDALPAVQNGNVILADEAYFYSHDLYSLNAQADYLLSSLLGTAD